MEAYNTQKHHEFITDNMNFDTVLGLDVNKNQPDYPENKTCYWWWLVHQNNDDKRNTEIKFFGRIGGQEFYLIGGSYMSISLYYFCFSISLGIHDIVYNELIARWF